MLFELYHVLTQHLGAAQRQTLLPEITQAWIKETGGLGTCMSDNQSSKSRTNKHAEGPRIISAFTLKGALEFICSSFYLNKLKLTETKGFPRVTQQIKVSQGLRLGLPQGCLLKEPTLWKTGP